MLYSGVDAITEGRSDDIVLKGVPVLYDRTPQPPANVDHPVASTVMRTSSAPGAHRAAPVGCNQRATSSAPMSQDGFRPMRRSPWIRGHARAWSTPELPGVWVDLWRFLPTVAQCKCQRPSSPRAVSGERRRSGAEPAGQRERSATTTPRRRYRPSGLICHGRINKLGSLGCSVAPTLTGDVAYAEKVRSPAPRRGLSRGISPTTDHSG